eukprot:CAMPEP_0179145868 /NCGR_PEP_ID=MMETSP0796-20121207/70408_1 /TAXON_ID=73915 /ORGANISM="Pyrodinium bahamense, Strain pbaha01" /LENGTH=117 /DNA_ID=CAMNT_0020846305 /DNA_START=213 /DNA_END=563 /DNA_ORIENTATION=+
MLNPPSSDSEATSQDPSLLKLVEGEVWVAPELHTALFCRAGRPIEEGSTPVEVSLQLVELEEASAIRVAGSMSTLAAVARFFGVVSATRGEGTVLAAARAEHIEVSPEAAGYWQGYV